MLTDVIQDGHPSRRQEEHRQCPVRTPGLQKDDVSIDVNNDILTVSGETSMPPSVTKRDTRSRTSLGQILEVALTPTWLEGTSKFDSDSDLEMNTHVSF